jgi:hypothetical protein
MGSGMSVVFLFPPIYGTSALRVFHFPSAPSTFQKYNHTVEFFFILFSFPVLWKGQYNTDVLTCYVETSGGQVTFKK